jgi:hypothetical protein
LLACQTLDPHVYVVGEQLPAGTVAVTLTLTLAPDCTFMFFSVIVLAVKLALPAPAGSEAAVIVNPAGAVNVAEPIGLSLVNPTASENVKFVDDPEATAPGEIASE